MTTEPRNVLTKIQMQKGAYHATVELTRELLCENWRMRKEHWRSICRTSELSPDVGLRSSYPKQIWAGALIYLALMGAGVGLSVLQGSALYPLPTCIFIVLALCYVVRKAQYFRKHTWTILQSKSGRACTFIPHLFCEPAERMKFEREVSDAVKGPENLATEETLGTLRILNGKYRGTLKLTDQYVRQEWATWRSSGTRSCQRSSLCLELGIYHGLADGARRAQFFTVLLSGIAIALFTMRRPGEFPVLAAIATVVAVGYCLMNLRDLTARTVTRIFTNDGQIFAAIPHHDADAGERKAFEAKYNEFFGNAASTSPHVS